VAHVEAKSGINLEDCKSTSSKAEILSKQEEAISILQAVKIPVFKSKNFHQ